MNNLKPCPFCGREVMLAQMMTASKSWYSIHCDDCKLKVEGIQVQNSVMYNKFDTNTFDARLDKEKQKLIDKWNERTYEING